MEISPTRVDHGASLAFRWLSLDGTSDTVVRVAAVGGVAAERADELWSMVEYALENADGRAVVVDLTAVTGFDLDTVDALSTVARTALRRHDNVHIIVLAGSSLSDYARAYGLGEPVIHTMPSLTWRAMRVARSQSALKVLAATSHTHDEIRSA